MRNVVCLAMACGHGEVGGRLTRIPFRWAASMFFPWPVADAVGMDWEAAMVSFALWRGEKPSALSWGVRICGWVACRDGIRRPAVSR